MISPATGCFEIVKVPTYDFDEVKVSKYEYIDKSSVRLSQLFTNTWLIRYIHPRNVVFDNGFEFKPDFTPLLKYLYIKPVLLTIKNPQAIALVEQVHQVILNMIVTKYFDNKYFNYIDPWAETLA